MTLGPMDGVEFYPLNFSERPEDHRRLDVILHKLSEDIMFRWGGGVVEKNVGGVLRIQLCLNRYFVTCCLALPYEVCERRVPAVGRISSCAGATQAPSDQ